MKRRLSGVGGVRGVFGVAAFLFLAISPGWGGPLGEDSIFQKLMGEWEGRGELKDAEGKVTRLKEKWTGKRDGENVVEMSGDREWGDEGTHQFSWRYLYNPLTELVECEMTMSTLENPVRFEVQVNEREKTFTLRARIGEGQSELQIDNKFEGDRIIGEVKMKDTDGNANLTGTVEHRRPDKWEE